MSPKKYRCYRTSLRTQVPFCRDATHILIIFFVLYSSVLSDKLYLFLAGPNGIRSWGVPKNREVNPEARALRMKRRMLNRPPTTLTGQRLCGECLHVGRPLAHCILVLQC